MLTRGSRLVRRLLVLVLEVVTVVLTVVIAGGVSAWTTRDTIERDAADKMVAVATTLATAPGVPAPGRNERPVRCALSQRTGRSFGTRRAARTTGVLRTAGRAGQ